MPKTKTQDKEERKERVSMTGTTPTPKELGEGTKLEWPYKGTVHKAVIIKRGDEFLVRVGKTISRSLSQAAQAISGHAQRGGICWRREGEAQPLLGRVNYAALAGATPAPAKPKAKAPARKRAAKASAPTAGKVKTRPAIKCTVKGCKEVFTSTTEASKHVAEAH